MLIDDVNQWERYGGGRVSQFYVTDEEVIYVLEKYLPEQYAPYTLIHTFMEKVEKHYEEKYQEYSLKEFLVLRTRDYDNFFIKSRVLSPILIIPHQMISKYLVNNGLIHLSHGLIFKNGWGASAISMVNKVINIDTGSLIKHKEYEKIFNALKRGFRKQLVYQVLEKWMDGRIVLERNVFMSKSFAEKASSGEIHTGAIPGDPLKEK